MFHVVHKPRGGRFGELDLNRIVATSMNLGYKDLLVECQEVSTTVNDQRKILGNNYLMSEH